MTINEQNILADPVAEELTGYTDGLFKDIKNRFDDVKTSRVDDHTITVDYEDGRSITLTVYRDGYTGAPTVQVDAEVNKESHASGLSDFDCLVSYDALMKALTWL